MRFTSYWRPGLTKPSDEELRVLENVGDAGLRNGVRVYVTVMSPGSATTPLTDEARADFAAYAAAIVRGAPSIEHLIVGNEPNLNRFWLPQFNLDGSSAAPAAYLALLAETYDAVKAVVARRAGLRRRASLRAERIVPTGSVPPTRRRRSSRVSVPPIGRAAARGR